MVFPRHDAQIVDTWTATGLRATGSHDVAVADIFVPAEHSLWWADGPKQPGPLYPVRWLIVTHAAHALGIARAAIDAVMDLAEHKTPTRSTGVLRGLPQMQTNLAQAEGLVQAARAFMWQTTAEVWDVLCERQTRHVAPPGHVAPGDDPRGAERRPGGRPDVGGGRRIARVYTRSPLERCFRDIHVATQHAAVGLFSLETIGAALISANDPQPSGASLI